MVTSGTPSPILVSQKRLTVVLSVLALLGSIALGIAWWDSAKYGTVFSNEKRSIYIMSSFVLYTPTSPMSFGVNERYYRVEAAFYDEDDSTLFPTPVISHDQIIIPIYLLILTYLAILLLIWVVLMNRLARRGSLWGNRSSNERA